MINKSNDAFGLSLLDYYNGEESEQIIERDDGYVDSVPCGLYFTEYKKWNSIEQKAIKFVQGRVLDIGCGAGRHSLYLQKKGYKVLGIDNSPLTVKVAKLRGVKNARVLPFEQLNKLQNLKFDTFLMFGNNFGLFSNFKRAKKQLSIFHKISNPNALIIAVSLNAYRTKLPEHLEYHKQNRMRGRMGGQIKIRIRYKKLIGPWFDYLFVSETELKKILAGTGWYIKKIIKQNGNSAYGMILINSNLRFATK